MVTPVMQQPGRLRRHHRAVRGLEERYEQGPGGVVRIVGQGLLGERRELEGDDDGRQARVQPFMTGSGPASARHPALTWVNTILGNIKRSLHGTYHHLSSKHLPRYLTECSYRFNRRFSLREMFPRLGRGST